MRQFAPILFASGPPPVSAYPTLVPALRCFRRASSSCLIRAFSNSICLIRACSCSRANFFNLSRLFP
eukprot:UN00508